ncbi:Dihydropteroate synthase-like protein [Irpex rosettiformis]|uniref:Dihydropteroate synthase-like protein n=1 Tax=Irpex rosettiformis TaxID=378272 RepID=A0ACB8U5I6_9APHY|nr:Dihydropteroate synthase-like protein [Irpex rosettiformis]
MANASQLSETPFTQDVIRVKNILLTPSFTDGAQWASQKAKSQPAYATLSIEHSISGAAATDDLALTINYSTVCKTVVEATKTRPFASSEDFLQYALDRCFAEHTPVNSISIEIVRPKALLQPACYTVMASGVRGSPYHLQRYSITRLQSSPIVGVNDCERVQTQLVQFDITWKPKVSELSLNKPFAVRSLAEKLTSVISRTEYLTLEALVSLVSQTTLAFDDSISSTTVCGGKPNALSIAEAPEVEITRTLADYSSTRSSATDSTSEPDLHRVAIALGSNLGDRFANIEYALRLLEDSTTQGDASNPLDFVTIVDTSFLYETEPMYVIDQPKFVNCACLVETNMSPVPLLKFLKNIEAIVGRVPSIRNGPRAVDLDIITYDEKTLDTRDERSRDSLDNLEGELVVPHPRLQEREFVLRPLSESVKQSFRATPMLFLTLLLISIIPDYVHPVSNRSIRDLLDQVLADTPANSPVMNKVIPFPQPYPASYASYVWTPSIRVPRTARYWVYPSAPSPSTPQKTYIMATLNATPDSFSDGSVNNTIDAGIAYTTKALESGADIIDVGGYSTRPGAAFVSTQEEIDRVSSMITAIRSKDRDAPISVDTFRWEVADAAARAGANCINDVYAFTGPAYPPTEESYDHLLKMREVARNHVLPAILMHSRGEASANKGYSQYAYAADGRGRGAVVEAVKVELGDKVDRIVKGKGGLRRWLVIVDPGVGFSKTLEGNLEVLREASATVHQSAPGIPRNPLAGYPILIGTSRKSFLGIILSQDAGAYKGRETKPVERGWATAAAVACAVQQRANVVRVHDVMELGDVVRVSERIWS